MAFTNFKIFSLKNRGKGDLSNIVPTEVELLSQYYEDTGFPEPQNLEEVLAQGNTSSTEEANIESLGLYDSFATPFGFAKVFVTNLKFYFKNKLGQNIFSLYHSGWSCIQSLYSYTFSIPTLTSNRIATFQDKSGVVAYLSDIPSLPTANYGLFSQTEESVAITGLTEETLIGVGQGTLEVPANAFQIGDSFYLRLSGKISSGNNSDLVFNLKSNAISIGTTGVLTIPTTTNKNWELTAEFTIRQIGPAGTAVLQTSGKLIYNKNSSNTFEGQGFDFTENTNFDTTILNKLDITATWLTFNASNSIHSHHLTLNKIY